jgi:lycopene cyclase-like protein
MTVNDSSAIHSDVLVIGGGPAALGIAAALGAEDLQVTLLCPQGMPCTWANTYGIWAEEVDSLGLGHLLAHRWQNTISRFGLGDDDPAADANRMVLHGRDYGLFDRQLLQQHWLDICNRHRVVIHTDEAVAISHDPYSSTVTTATGKTIQARLVIDATGHKPLFVRQVSSGRVAAQAAYGVVARFERPPIATEQFVFMDYRCHHLSAEQRREPPTFLYAMHLGEDRYFVEETSLALAPAVPFAVLQQRLAQRLARQGAVITAIEHEEFCLFPMNPPLPALNQRVVGFGGAAGMVHPASGFMVGSLLRRAPQLAQTIAAALSAGDNGSTGISGPALAQQAWSALWPAEEQTRRAFYRFGLQKLMGFDQARLRHHFEAFFQLPDHDWYGFLTNTLNLVELGAAMAKLFALAPWDVRAGLLLPARPAPAWPGEAAADGDPTDR